MKYGLIGEKLGHSFSVPIHKAFGNPEFCLKEIPKKDLKEFLTKKDFYGINVTIPYKQDVMPYCILEEAAEEIGAVNTVIRKDGMLYGYNTDAFGLSSMIDLCLNEKNVSLKGKGAVILGAGGTAKTAVYVLRKKGVSKITILARNPKKAEESFLGKDILTASIEEIPEVILQNTDIIVNTTPIGMFPNNDGVPVDLSAFRKLSGVFDVVYNPLNTKLVQEAKRLGIPAINGLYMLVLQALRAEWLFRDALHGEDYFLNSPTEEDADKVFEDLKKSLINVVLIGMPGCGKTTVGKMLAEKLQREYSDLDEEFTAEFSKNPGEWIESFGEADFRKNETAVVKKIAAKNGLVISTGGGVVTREENIEFLKQNGILVYIKRDLANLSSEGRPLSKGDGAIERLFEKRKNLYEAAADYVIEISEGNPEKTVSKLIKAIGF